MAEFSWIPDIQAGVMRNHALSSKIRSAALAKSKFMDFVNAEPGYGKGKGESITIPRVKNMTEPTDSTFGERERVPVDTFSISTVAITVQYYGRAVEYTEKAQLLTHFNIKDQIQKKLRAQMTLVLDSAAAAAFKTAKITFSPTSLSNGTFETGGAATVTATQNGTIAHLQVIRDYLMDTIHVPGWNGGDDFYCLASTKFCRGLRRDPDFIEAHKYTGGGYLATGEIGKIENIHVVEVNHTQALANNKGSGAVLGEAVVFGDDAVAMAVAMDPELRAAIPSNYGLQHGVAWVGLLKYGIIWDTANDGEARIVYITSA